MCDKLPAVSYVDTVALTNPLCGMGIDSEWCMTTAFEDLGTLLHVRNDKSRDSIRLVSTGFLNPGLPTSLPLVTPSQEKVICL